MAIIPAHNEEDGIAETVAGIRRQVDLVFVVLDNCSDRTAELAVESGALILTTVDNRAKKAGALNQALEIVLPELDSEDAILIQDADSVLDLGFISVAKFYLRQGNGAVGGTFRGRSGGGLVGWFQRNEYARYERDVRRLHGRKRPLVLTGTATVFKVATLRAVQNLFGRVYDEEVLTEDNRLTFDLIAMGIPFVTPPQCTLTTEVMPTWRALAAQRLRWKRGALENLRQFGMRPRWTWPYWGRQALSIVGCAVTAIYLSSLAYGAVSGFHLHLFWLAITAVFMVERAVSVRKRGAVAVLVASTIVVESVYDIFIQSVHVRAVAQSIFNRERRW